MQNKYLRYSAFLLLFGLFIKTQTAISEELDIPFSIEQGNASETLLAFSKQADLTFAADVTQLSQIKTNSVKGHYSIAEGLSILLADTPIHWHLNIAADTLSISVATPACTSQVECGMETIEIRGIKRSLNEETRLKRSDNRISDNLSASGIGQLPDLNTAEALQRITGIQLDRTSEMRTGTVVLHGLDGEHIKTLFMGMPLANGNAGGFTYGMLQSDILQSIRVYKNRTASMEEGAAAGTIDLVTIPKKDYQDKFTLALKSTYETANDSYQDAISTSLTKYFDQDRIYTYLAYSHEDLDFRRDVARIVSYHSTIQQVGDKTIALELPSNFSVYTRNNQGFRETLTGAVHWSPDMPVELRFDFLQGSYDLDIRRKHFHALGLRQAEIIKQQQGGEMANSPALSFRDGFGTLTSALEVSRREVNAATLSLDWQSSENLLVSSKLHWTQGRFDWMQNAARLRYQNRLVQSFDNHLAITLNSGVGEHEQMSVLLSNPYTLSPDGELTVNTFTLFAYGGEDRFNFEQQKSVQFEANLTVDDWGINTLFFGLKYGQIDSRRGQTEHSPIEFKGPLPIYRRFFQSPVPSQTSFFDGVLSISSFTVPDLDLMLQELFDEKQPTAHEGQRYSKYNENIPVIFARDEYLLSNYHNRKKTLASYMNIELGREDWLFSPLVNLGWRYLDIKRENSGLHADFYTDPTKLASASTYLTDTYETGYFLPNIDASFTLTRAWLARLSYNENIQRIKPEMESNSSLIRGYPGESGAISRILWRNGGVDIPPIEIDIWNASVEWYGEEGQSLSLHYFENQFDAYVIKDGYCPTHIEGYASATTGELSPTSKSYCLDEAGIKVLATKSMRIAKRYKFQGYEVAYLYPKLSFFPSPWDQFGFAINYSHAQANNPPFVEKRGNKSYLNIGSGDVTNAVVFWENADWSIRLAYNYRDKYFLRAREGVEDRIVASRGLLDLALSYQLTEESKLRFEIFNALEKPLFEYSLEGTRLRKYIHEGRIMSASVEFTFD